MRLRSIAFAAALALAAGSAPRIAAAQEVDAALVLALDVSGSVTTERFELQRSGAADALMSSDFIEAVSRSPRHAVAIAIFEWSGYGEQSIVVPWTIVRSAEEAATIAEAVRAAPRAYNGSTAVGEAIEFAAGLLAKGPSAERRVIDVSGDGRANAGGPANAARDAAVAAGIIVNGLPILDVEEGLEGWYRANVQGGARSFTMPARTLIDFREALLAKIVREIS
jgi:hypothetical protein